MGKISAVILYAGEASIVDAVGSVGFCEEIIIVQDSSSLGRGVPHALKNNPKIKVCSKTLTSFSEQRNFGMSRAKSEWVLFIDADEVISSRLSKKIIEKISKGKEDGYRIRRVDNFLGTTITKGELLNIYLLRLAKKNKGKWSGVVHEQWRVGGKIGKISEPILHSPHPTIYEFVSEIERYTTLRSWELRKTRMQANSFSVILYPLAKFTWNYLFKLGFLEGNRGFVLSMMMSFHSFLVRGKLYTDQKRMNLRSERR